MGYNKKSYVMKCVVILSVIMLTGLLMASCNNLPKNGTKYIPGSFNSDIIIQRTDGQSPLMMPYKYSRILLEDKYLYKEEIFGISIASVKYEINSTGMSWDGFTDVLVNTDSKMAKDAIKSVKYCIGITDLNAIILDKGESDITLYEGYSADLLISSSQDYVIIPSSISSYINNKLPAGERALVIQYTDTGLADIFTIIGEYTAEDEQDTLYLSYSGFSELILAGQNDISDHVDSLQIDVNEEKDLTKFAEYLCGYFADSNLLAQYSDRLNMLNEPYLYRFVHSMNINPIILETPEEEEANFNKSRFTISRTDGNVDLGMSYKYADALIRDYETYSQYITDIVISTGVKGVDPRDYPPFTNVPSYELHLSFDSGFANDIKDPLIFASFPYHQAITSISEIKRMKSDCEITFYGDYTNKDLVVPRQKDCKGFIKGYAIIPATLDEASQNKGNLASFDNYNFYLKEKNAAPLSYAINPGFKVIGYYTTTDEYDTVYITYAGSNEKYKKEPFKSECIESIVIETKGNIDITPLIEYLEQFFVPSDNIAKYMGKKNVLNMEYEFYYSMTDGTE